MTDITPAVAKAIEDIKASFSQCAVEVEPDGQGGANVTVLSLIHI